MTKEEIANLASLLAEATDEEDDDDEWGEIEEDVPPEAVAQVQLGSGGLAEGVSVGAIATTLMSIPGIMEFNCMPEKGLILLNLDTRILTPEALWEQIQADETLRPSWIK